MNYQEILDGIRRYGSNERDVCIAALGVEPDRIRERVILAPWWEPGVFARLGLSVTPLDETVQASIRMWEVDWGTCAATYIKTGIGAPKMLDVVLALGLTACRKAVFIGSVGSLDPVIGIGDLVVPEYSVCGDGASRYLADGPLDKNDVFGSRARPDAEVFGRLVDTATRICAENKAGCHIGRTFSIDTIIAQFAHIEELVGSGCNTVEMESAVAFRAAEIAGISMGALFSVSDNTVTRKSLLSGRTEEDNQYRRNVREHLIPQILAEVLA